MRRLGGIKRKHRRRTAPVPLPVVRQSDYETVLAALRDFIRITETPHQTYGTDECLRLAEIRTLARTARPDAPEPSRTRRTANRGT